MSVLEDDVNVGNNSFWELENYKRTVKRAEDGSRLCDELMKLIRERAAIEKEYAMRLRSWSKTWSDRIDKAKTQSWPEYGTTASAWKGVLTEADRMAEIHMQIKDNLTEKVERELSLWKKENFRKSALGPCKETKALEEDFKKAQKPWAKKYTKLLKAKKDYHQACRTEKSVTNQENNARADSAVSQDNMKKLSDKVEKCRKEVETNRVKYEAALSDLNAYNAKYMEDMTDVFTSSQEREAKRLNHFKEMLFGVHDCLDISQNTEIPDIYAQYHSTIDQADYEKDLKWWSINNGVDMPMNWPVFEEYSPDMHTISRKEKKTIANDGVTITNIKKNRDSTYADDYNDRNNMTASQPPPRDVNANQHKEASAPQQSPVYSGVDEPSFPPPQIEQVPPVSAGSSDNNPFGDDEELGVGTEYDNPLEDDGTDGVPVRALYDYDGAEEDELTFKTGDVFVKLRDRDDQGWCKGRKDGNVGLYPDNYVQVISD